MKYKIDYTKQADKTFRKWKKSNPRLYKKGLHIVDDIALHPRTGLGHPEPLVGGRYETYSRHITAHDRIVYVIKDEEITVVIIQAEEHYDDK